MTSPQMAKMRKAFSSSVAVSRAFRFASAAALAVVAFFALTIQHLSELEAHLNRGDPGFMGSGSSEVKVGSLRRDEVAGAGVEDEEPSEVYWNLPIVHILTTRFMQDQAHLLDLARARLFLFERFCLPTVLGQTIFDPYSPGEALSADGSNRTEDAALVPDPSFLWIIKTDPDLPPEILSRLVSLISPYPQFYVVGSNVNFGVGIKAGGWRGGQAGKDLLLALREGRLHCGDVGILRRAHAARSERIVLETRLDADDGLNFLYLEGIQRDSVKYLNLGWKGEHNPNTDARYSTAKIDKSGQARGPADWMYWCAFAHVAWDPFLGLPFAPANKSTAVANPSLEMHGLFVPWKTPTACVTAGLTTGASVGLVERDIPRFPHQTIVQRLCGFNATAKSCGLPNRADCLKLVSSPLVAAFRSRTPTSAGMKDISGKLNQAELIVEEKSRNPKMQKSMWAVLQRYFGIIPAVAKEANDYMKDHLVEIAKDNLRGQCTKGHSCKLAAREELARLIDLAEVVRRRGRMR